MKKKIFIKLLAFLLLGIVLVGVNTQTETPGLEILENPVTNYNC